MQRRSRRICGREAGGGREEKEREKMDRREIFQSRASIASIAVEEILTRHLQTTPLDST
jgi:hypothetical protein